MANIRSIEIVNTSNSSSDGAAALPFVFEIAYKGDELTRRVADILGLPDTNGWSVIDTCEHLAMVHYTEDADMNIYGKLRGILVDTEVGVIIADSFGYTPAAVSSKINENNGQITIMDKENNNHVFNPNEIVIKRVFEGVVIRVIWHKGHCYRITHRKINPIRSRWGSAKSFISMYEEANGPTADQLFDTTKPYSNTCYDFLVVDQSLLVGTRQKVTNPYLVYLSQRTMNINRPAEEMAPGRASFVTTNIMGGEINKSIIHEPKQLSIEEANHHLNFGYYNSFENNDERQLTGEAVIVYKINNGVIHDIIKVHSPAYEWRVNLRGNNPNIVNQFYHLLNSVYGDVNTPESWEKFKQRFIIFPLYDEQSLKDLYTQTNGILTIPSGAVFQEDYKSRDSRIHLLWINYVLSLPASKQVDGLNILTNFKNDRNNVINWLQTLESSISNIEGADGISSRVKGLINSSRSLARKRKSDGYNYSAKGTYMKLPVLIKSTIRNLINKEDGPSLYSLVRELRDFRAKEQEQKQQPNIVNDTN